MSGSESKKTILIVDDAPANIQAIHSLLKDDYRTQIATSGEKALAIACSDHPPQLVLLDIMMPDLDGYEVCSRLKSDPRTCEIPVIFITGKVDLEDEVRGFQTGCVDYITKPISPPILLARVKTQFLLAEAREFLKDQNQILESRVRERTRELTKVQEATLLAFGSLAETRDNETGNHLRRTQHYLRALARRLQNHPAFTDYLSDEMIEGLFRSAPLHDIGKVGIPDRILLKPARLSAEEFEVMKTHTVLGRDSIAAAEKHLGEYSEFLTLARQIAYGHHERWDGSGYPQGLKGEEIPACARLMAVADVYDALISERVYKRAFPHEVAVQAIREGSGSQFDPTVVDAFVEMQDEFLGMSQQFADDCVDQDQP
ncbi:two-component system response regulator [bacterium]|nr:two-component system response regulator [bacterium]